MRSKIGFCIVGLFLFSASTAAATVRIDLAEDAKGLWTASYRLTAPAKFLEFVRNPNDQRVRDWQPEKGFEIIHTDGQERIRRKDGRPFRDVRVSTPAKYSMLPKDYPPFSPFGDGGLLIHTGRFFACPEACNDESLKWQMSLTPLKGAWSIVGGERRRGTSNWTEEGGNGRMVYVGRARPAEQANLLWLIDLTLPAGFRDPLAEMFPKFMNYYTQRLGLLQKKPTLFVSYDPKGGSGHGSQGSALGGDVAMHIFGDWSKRFGEPNLVPSTGWLFAHEAAHLFQGGVAADNSESWIHEGSAELMAAYGIAESLPSAAGYVEKRKEKAVADCAAGLKDRALSDAAAAGRFDLYYSCGLVMHIRFDRAIRAAKPGSDGTFALWRDYRVRVEQGAPANEQTFLTSLRELAGNTVAGWARHIANDRLADPVADLST